MSFRDVVCGAAEQYGDLRGTLAMDGHQGGEIYGFSRACGLPGGYFPVALAMHSVGPALTIYAVRHDEVGGTADEVIQYIKQRGEDQPLPVYAFEVKEGLPELLKYVKRLTIVARSWKVIGEVPLGVKEYISNDPQ